MSCSQKDIDGIYLAQDATVSLDMCACMLCIYTYTYTAIVLSLSIYIAVYITSDL